MSVYLLRWVMISVDLVCPATVNPEVYVCLEGCAPSCQDAWLVSSPCQALSHHLGSLPSLNILSVLSHKETADKLRKC